MNKYKAILAGAALLAVPAVGLASINIDVQGDNAGGDWWGNDGTYSGTAADAGVGGTWNGVWYPVDWEGNLVAPLVDDTGVNSDVQFSSSWTRDHWSPPGYIAGSPYEALMADYSFNNDAFVGDGSGATFSLFTDNTALTGGEAIVLGQLYDIYIYACGDNTGASTFKLTQTAGDITKTANYVGGFDGVYTEDVDYVKFSGVLPTATANGAEFAFEWGSDGASSAAINGIQIVAVPEPATIGLVGLAGAGILFIRRRIMM